MEFDYVIVGGGSAGCALAARLSEDPATSRVPARGGRRGRLGAHRRADPAVPSSVPRRIHNWALRDGAAGRTRAGAAATSRAARRSAAPARSTPWSTSAAIRATTTTGRRLGNPGWAWPRCCPYFRRSEHNERGADAFHGTRRAAERRRRCARRNPLHRAFVEAAQAVPGMPRNADFNGADAGGRRPLPGHAEDGRRWSAARAYLDAGRRRAQPRGASPARRRRACCFEGKACRRRRIRRGGRRELSRAPREVRRRRRRLQLAAAADALRHRPAPTSCAATASRCAHELPGVGATCRTTSTTSSAGPSRSLPTCSASTPRGGMRLAREIGALPARAARHAAPPTSPRRAAS